jgi:hydrogenase-1 operon protein HyaF
MLGNMGIENIPVVTQSCAPAAASPLTGNATAVLHEVAALLDALAQRGETGVIDLGGMPLSHADKAWLVEKLGPGEIEMTLDLEGISQIRETAFHGVWWLIHRNENSVVTGEFIEVSRVPELVLAHADDIRHSAESLNRLIGDL